MSAPHSEEARRLVGQGSGLLIRERGYAPNIHDFPRAALASACALLAIAASLADIADVLHDTAEAEDG